MTRVNLPPGCMGFKADDGTRYVAKPGTHVDVADHHVKALKSNNYAQAGLVDAGAEKFFARTSRAQGRWCRSCNFLGHSWMASCPRCGSADIIAEGEMNRPKLQGQYMP